MYVKKAVFALVLAALCAAFLPAMAADAPRGYVKGQGYQYVALGEYPYEKDGEVKPVLWRVLENKDGRALLLTEYVIDTSQIIFETDEKVIKAHSYRRISSYAESDLYPLLNGEYIRRLFGDDPIQNALLEEPGLGRLFILTTEQYLNTAYGFSANMWNEQKTRQAVGTPYATKQRNLYADASGKVSYWAATIKNPEDYKLQLIGYNGHMSWGAYTRVNVGLRLAVRLDMAQLAITGGNGTKESPFTLAYQGATAAAPAPDAEAPAETSSASQTPAAAETPAPTAAPVRSPAPAKADGAVTLSFIGDCSIGDSAQYKKASSSFHTTIDEKGYAWPFSLVADYLKNDDLTVANLEVVLTERTAHADKKYYLSADPDHVQILLESGIDAVNTVNNHCMDFMQAGYQDTLDLLDENGVAHFGTVYPGQKYGHDDLYATNVGDLRIGFIGFSYPQDSDQKKIASRIKKLRNDEGCDLVIVSLHWGRETHMTPESWQISYAKQVISAGADVIYSHHPHVIQPIQFYMGKPIFYSTGNFTFGTMSKVDPSTGIFQLTYRKEEGKAVLQEMRVIPCQTQSSPDFRPYELTDPAQREAVFDKLVLKRDYANCVNPPESFLKTGVIRFENGQMLP